MRLMLLGIVSNQKFFMRHKLLYAL